MPIVLFLIDTSMSMNRRAPSGKSLLDLAKNSVEAFIKKRSHEPISRGDRYMLLTTETPYNIQIEWKESSVSSLNEFHNKLRNLKISGSANIEQSITKAFDLLNLHRAHNQVDNYGKGRIPWFVEVFSMIVFITDGGVSKIDQEISLSDSKLKTWEITSQAYRWDQRMFSLVLQPDTVSENTLFLDNGPISKACELTGGKSYLVKNERTLQTSIDTIVQKIQPGVVCNFRLVKPVKSFNLPDNYDEITQTIPQSTRKMLLLKTKTAQNGMPTNSPITGHWPIPENFLPQPNNHKQKIPYRQANPNICFVPVPKPAKYISAFAFDKYELENSQLTMSILNLYKQGQDNPEDTSKLLDSSTAWYVYIIGSNGKNYDESYHGYDYQNSAFNQAIPQKIPTNIDPKNLPPPFGYLKPNQALNAVNLYVMPYNFTKLLPLIEELTNCMRLNQKSTRQWEAAFSEYLFSTPVYYYSHMKKAFKAMNAPIPAILNQDFQLLSVSSMDQLKTNREKANREMNNFEWKGKPAHVSGFGPPQTLRTSIPLKSIIPDDNFLTLNFPNFRIDNHLMKKEVLYPYTNPFHIDRSQLLSQLKRMKKNVEAIINLPNLIETAENSHIRTTQQISKMGQFEDRMKLMPKPLRDVGIGQKSVRSKQSGFGNPYKKKATGVEDSFDLDDNLESGSLDLMNADRPTCRRRKILPKFDAKQWAKKKLSWEKGDTKIGYVPDLDLEKELNQEIENAIKPSEDGVVPKLRTSSPYDSKFNQKEHANSTSGLSSLNFNSRPGSRNIRTPVEIAKARQAIKKIESLLKQPGDVKTLKNQIRTEISEFDDAGNVDLLVLKIKLTNKSIEMCEKFKRRLLQHYLIYLLRSYKDELKRLTVHGSGRVTPKIEITNKDIKNDTKSILNRVPTNKIHSSSKYPQSSKNTFRPIQTIPPQHSINSTPESVKSKLSRENSDAPTAPLPKRQKLDSVGNTPNTSPTHQTPTINNPETQSSNFTNSNHENANHINGQSIKVFEGKSGGRRLAHTSPHLVRPRVPIKIDNCKLAPKLRYNVLMKMIDKLSEMNIPTGENYKQALKYEFDLATTFHASKKEYLSTASSMIQNNFASVLEPEPQTPIVTGSASVLASLNGWKESFNSKGLKVNGDNDNDVINLE